MTEKKPSFLDAIKKAQELKTKITPENASKIHQAKNTPKSQVTTNKPTTRNTGRGR